ncbi:regulator of nonsense transcripts 3B-like isoform X3 [Manduca sexta]|uniref:regulator of nonsense transcripts 3B isoform X3 n=1 Tax=Manduca sexta TaxID=7130 RepID=UPI00118385B8|nr:regulator of nonsense transcripts 3B isoform X3 [Manduca sexta]XP_037301024.1 regulator of nonsense transcripts 3B-like isoform X3 [Manduca sexta]
MTEDQDAKDSQSDSGNKAFANKNKDRKTKAQRPLIKIILRRLPPTMTEESFMEQVSPIPEHDYFYFARPDPSLGNNLYSRAYINFVNVDDIFLFKDKFDGYVFLDDKGVEYVGIVEYAPFQRIPKKKKKKDPKCGTIESDPIYQEFMENLTKEPETENQPKLEYAYPVNDANDKKVQSTPLLEYLAARKQDKRGRDERRRRENDKRKMRIERKTKDTIKEEDNGENEVKKIKSREWEKEKIETKDEHVKSNNQDGSVFESKTYREQRKTGLNVLGDKKKRLENDRKDGSINDDQGEESEAFKRDKRDKVKESPRELKSKKYSDTRKERIKQNEFVKSERQSAVSKIIAESKGKTLNDDIKPFTQLPQVKTDDLTKLIEGMDKKMKFEEAKNQENSKDHSGDKVENDVTGAVIRRSSLESNDVNVKETALKRQTSLDDRSKSTDREGSEEKEKTEGTDQRTERRIRNKDRPSLVIYQPGMGKFSKQRLAKEKETHIPGTSKGVNDSEKKDT